MRIGIDIDGCLVDFYSFTYTAGEMFCREHGCGYLADPTGHTPEEIWGFTDEERDAFWEEFQGEYVCDASIRFDAVDVIRRLREEGHEIIIVTARRSHGYWFIPSLSPQGEELTIQWLDKNEIEYDQIIFGEDDKGGRCEEMGIELFVDDSPRNLRTLDGKTHTVVFWAPCNDTDEFAHLPHINNWWEFYDIVQEVCESYDEYDGGYEDGYGF